MRRVREAFEAKVLLWPGVTRKEMMGCLVYFRGRKFFAFLVTNGLVVTKLTEADRAKLAGSATTKPFRMAGRTSSNWIQVDVRNPSDVTPVLTYVRRSYDAARATT